MTPQAIIKNAAAEGVRLTLSASGNIKAAGDGAALSRWAAVIREHKAAIVGLLAAAMLSGQIISALRALCESYVVGVQPSM